MVTPERIGRYPVKKLLGTGTFASVWLATDKRLDGPVAIKVLADNWAQDRGVRKRFREEARILRRADSDRVVRVYDTGKLPDGQPYFVMTYADLGTLEDRLATGPLPIDEALPIAIEVTHAVAVLHQIGVIHRDIKPSNVLIQNTRDGLKRILIADLGLAKQTAYASGFTAAAGTPGYMAPEQQRLGYGLDARADIYALGALTHQLVTGVTYDPTEDQSTKIPPELREGLAPMPLI